MGKVYVGQKRVRITVPTNIDLTDTTVKKLLVKKPNGMETSWVASILGSPSSGELLYYTVAGDLNVGGLYQGMAYVETENGGIYYGETFSFKIWERWK